MHKFAFPTEVKFIVKFCKPAHLQIRKVPSKSVVPVNFTFSAGAGGWSGWRRLKRSMMVMIQLCLMNDLQSLLMNMQLISRQCATIKAGRHLNLIGIQHQGHGTTVDGMTDELRLHLIWKDDTGSSYCLKLCNILIFLPLDGFDTYVRSKFFTDKLIELLALPFTTEPSK